jgi:hypothetical protein
MSGSFQIPSQVIHWSHACFEKYSKSLKTSKVIQQTQKYSHDNFSGVRVSMVLGLLAWLS